MNVCPKLKVLKGAKGGKVKILNFMWPIHKEMVKQLEWIINYRKGLN